MGWLLGLIAAIFLGACVVGAAVMLIHHGQNELIHAEETPVTLQQEGIVNQTRSVVRPARCSSCVFPAYQLTMHVNIRNESGDKHTVILCAPRVADNEPDCDWYTLQSGAKIVMIIKRKTEYYSKFKVLDNGGLAAIDNHPVIPGYGSEIRLCSDGNGNPAICGWADEP